MAGHFNNKTKLAFSALLDWAEVVVGTIFVVIFLLTFFINTVCVNGSSMEYTLYDGDRLLLVGAAYTPKTGDVVVIKNGDPGEYVIKRVIGISGQTVTIDYIAGTVMIDGEIIYEPYIKDGALDDTGNFETAYYDSERQVYEYHVPEDSLFVMGDNRDRSADSRSFGMVGVDDVEGKAIFKVYSEHGHMGPVR